jgi:FlgD Ig-like domain
MANLLIRTGSSCDFRFLGLLAFFVTVSCASVFAQIPSWEWVANGRLTGTPVFGGITTYGIGVDNGGNVYFGGSVADPSIVGATTLNITGSNDILLAKTNSTGAIQWAKTYGTANWDQILDMVTDTAGNLYAQIYFGSPSFNLDGHIVTSLIFGVCIAKFDANGMCTAAKSTQNISIGWGGMDYSPLGFMAAANFTTVSKVNMNCDTIWTRTISTGLNASVIFYDVSIDPSGNIIACGTFGGSAAFGAFTLTTPSTADLDNFVVKYNTNGTVLWAKQFGLRGTSNEIAFSIATDNGGHAYVHGHYLSKMGIGSDTLTNGGPFQTIYLAKYSPTGVYEWSLNGTSTNQSLGRQVVCDADNDIWLAFNPSGTVNFAGQDHIPYTSSGTMIVSIDTSGAFKARLKPDGLGLSDPKRLVFNRAGTAFYVGGYHIASNPTVVTFGSTTLNTSGCFVAKGIPGITTDVKDDDIRIPSDFTLEQNYPNPFNPSTTISYSVTTKSHVTIEIFNVMGQKIRTLVNTSLSAGEYQIEWDGSNDSGDMEASGVYYYRLRAGHVAETKKMVLLK